MNPKYNSLYEIHRFNVRSELARAAVGDFDDNTSDVRFMVTSYKATASIVTQISAHIGCTNQARWKAESYAQDTAKILKWVHSMFIVAAFLAGGGDLHRPRRGVPSGELCRLHGHPVQV